MEELKQYDRVKYKDYEAIYIGGSYIEFVKKNISSCLISKAQGVLSKYNYNIQASGTYWSIELKNLVLISKYNNHYEIY